MRPDEGTSLLSLAGGSGEHQLAIIGCRAALAVLQSNHKHFLRNMRQWPVAAGRTHLLRSQPLTSPATGRAERRLGGAHGHHRSRLFEMCKPINARTLCVAGRVGLFCLHFPSCRIPGWEVTRATSNGGECGKPIGAQKPRRTKHLRPTLA